MILQATARALMLSWLVLATLDGRLYAQDHDRSREPDFSKPLADRVNTIVEDALSSLRLEFGFPVADSSSIPAPRDTVTTPSDSTRPTLSYDGPTTIAPGDTVAAHLAVTGGDLTIAGVVQGDVLVVGGSLFVKSTGRVTGNARVINGQIVRDEGGVIEGYMDESGSTASHREQAGAFVLHSHRFRAPWVPENTTLDFLVLRYNRVENIFLGLGSDKRYYWDGLRRFSLYGSIGYGFNSHQWRGNLGITRQFAFPDDKSGSSHIVELGAEAHSYTDSKDQWLISVEENSLAAFFIHEDFRDYFERQGITALAAWYFQDQDLTTQFKVEMNFDEETSMSKRTDWALFGGNKRFRDNPPIVEGKMHSLVLSAGLSTTSKTRHGIRGWTVYGTAEFSSKDLGSEFSFSQLILDARRYQPLGRHDGMNFRVRGGTSGGSLPLQRTYDIGGLGTLPGFPFKDRSGNRILLGNIEFIVNGDIFGDLEFWPSWLMRHINILLFADAGWIGSASVDATWIQGFESISFSQFRSDLGFGFASRTGAFRIGWAWRTDKNEAVRFVLRVARPF